MRFFAQAKVLSAMVLGALLLLSSASTSRASFFYEVFDDGSNVGVVPGGVQTAPGPTFSNTFTTPNFSITITSGFETQNAVTSVLNTNLQASMESGAGQHTIEVRVVFTDFTLPADMDIHAVSSASATFTNSTAGDKSTFQAWGNAANTSAFNTGATAGQQSVTSPGGSTVPMVLTPDQAAFDFVRSGNFAMSQTLTLSLTNAAGSAGQIQGTTTITATNPIPAPAGLALVLSGLPVLGLGALLRRRKKA